MKSQNSVSIKADKTIEQFRQEFRQTFPKLDIRFYQHAHQKKDGSSADDVYDSSLKFSEIGLKSVSGAIDISPDHTVAEVESDIEKLYGLHAQVFRKSGSAWLQTTSTDGWTLAKQVQKANQSEIDLSTDD